MIGTTAALIGASVAGSAIQAGAVNKGSKAQKDAAQQQIALQGRVYDETVARLDPWVQSGLTADQAASSMLGLGAAPMIGGTAPQIETITTPGAVTTSQPALGAGFGFGMTPSPHPATQTGQAGQAGQAKTSYRVNGQDFDTMEAAQAYANANKTGGTAWQWQASPAYDWNLSQGLGAIEAGQAAKGGLYSGAAMKAAQDYGAGMASNEYWNIYNALAGKSGAGASAAAGQGQAGANYAQGASNALANYGNAAAAGAMGVGNAISGGINNAMSTWGYLQGVNALKGAA